MNCAGCVKFMDAYMDGELEPGMMLQVDDHLTECSDCSALFKLKTKMKTMLKEQTQVKAPPHLRQAIENRSTSAVPFFKPLFIAPLAAAAVIIFAVFSQVSDSKENRIAALLNDVVDHHVRELPLEITRSTGQNAAGWFHGKVDFPVQPLSTGIKNVSFQGARVSNVREHPAAEMSYLVDGQKVTFMTFPAANIMLRSKHAKTVNGHTYFIGQHNGYNVAMTRRGDIIYAVSSGLPVSRLVSLLSGKNPQ
jgi:anti-sigma factor RsiW